MTLRKAYYYFFYKFYRFSEAAPSRWWSEWKASFSMDALIVFVLLIAGGYYSITTKRDMLLGGSPKVIIWIVGLSIALINYFIFNHRDKWRSYVEEFDAWPKKKNRIGSIVVWSIVFLIFANLIFMYYLMSQIDWKQYR